MCCKKCTKILQFQNNQEKIIVHWIYKLENSDKNKKKKKTTQKPESEFKAREKKLKI